MKPDEIKAKVQGAYQKAMANRSMQMMRDSIAHRLLRDVRLYGRDAGADFVETHLDGKVQEAVSMAECRSTSLEIPAYGFCRAAVEGITQALRDLTGLKVDASGTTVRLIWAEPSPGFV
jgi:hypothetical protein